MKTGQLRVREGYIDGYGFFIYDDEKGHHRNKFPGFLKDGVEVLYSMERHDEVMINQLIENRENYIKTIKKRIENIEKEIEYLKNINLPLQ